MISIYEFFYFNLFYKTFTNFNINLTNIQYFKLSLFLIGLSSFISLYKLKIFYTSSWEYILNNLHSFTQSTIKSTFGDHYPFTVRLYNYYPFLFHIFIFILMNNLLGLIPYGFSNSAFLLHNFTLSFSCLIGLTFIGLFIQGIYYYQLFIPKNVPKPLIPFLMLIELISHVAKIFSLAIRLFANIMSSHILLHILGGFTIKILNYNLILGLIPCIIILMIVFLEIGIAFLQAYVFTILLAIYFEETFILLKFHKNLEKFSKYSLILDYDFKESPKFFKLEK